MTALQDTKIFTEQSGAGVKVSNKNNQVIETPASPTVEDEQFPSDMTTL